MRPIHTILRSAQVTQVLIMQSSPASCHFLPLRTKYSPQCPVLKHCQPMLVPLVWETKFHTHTKQQVKSEFYIV
jgi:hypothetical protein